MINKQQWQRVKFGDVVKLNTERCANPAEAGIERYVGLEHIEPEDLRIRRWGLVTDGTTFTNLFRPGQTLFGKRRAYQRKVAVADFTGVCSGDIYVFEPKDPSVLLPKLLPFICQTDSFFDYAVGTSAGSLSPRTNWTELAQYEFALSPLDEQRSILTILATLTDVQEAYNTALLASSKAEDSLCHTLLHGFPESRYLPLGRLAKFTSGKQIKVTSLPQERTAESPIPVYGGNGISGYTHRPLSGVTGPTIVIGRVGQYCGATHLTVESAWITDNALYPVEIDSRIELNFLAMCLKGANINRSKLGEYLPLITQKVVHSIDVPLIPHEEQQHWVKHFQELCLGTSRLQQRHVSILSFRKHLSNQLLSEN